MATRTSKPAVSYERPCLQELPEIVESFEGARFNPHDLIWVLRTGNTGSKRLSFESLERRLSPELLHAYKRCLIWLTENYASLTVHRTHLSFLKLIEHAHSASKHQAAPLSEVDEPLLVSFLSSPGLDVPNHLVRLQGLLRRWVDQGHPGVSAAAYDYINKRKVGHRDDTLPVETLCPVVGPLSTMERDAFDAAYHQAYAEGRIGEEDYVLISLLTVFGPRPAQLAQLKTKDILRERRSDGTYQHVIRIPSAKKKVKPRAQFKMRLLLDDFGAFLHDYAGKIDAEFKGELKAGEAPLFPLRHQKHEREDGFAFHAGSSTLTTRILALNKALKVPSERTGGTLHIAAVRFRRTLGTVLAEEGHPQAVIADALDHATLDTVKSYVAVTGKLQHRLNKALAQRLAPIANAFNGVVVDRDAVTSSLPPVRAAEMVGTFEPIGKCGTMNRCRYSAPVACYTCPNFRPFRDAPHEALLDFLLAERERILSTGETTLAVIEDRTLVAVADVVRLCQEPR